MDCPFARDDIGAHRARRLDQAERHGLGEPPRSAARPWRAPLRRWGAGRVSMPNTSGFCTTTQAVSSSISAARSSALPGDGGAVTSLPPCQARRIGAHRLGIMRMQTARQTSLAALGYAARHQHGLGGRGRAVIHRGVRDLHAGEQRHLGLEFEQDLQRALRDFGLIGRVGGEKFRALDQMIDAGRNMMAVGARAAEERHRSRRRVGARQRRHVALDLELARVRRQIERGHARGFAARRGTARRWIWRR